MKTKKPNIKIDYKKWSIIGLGVLVGILLLFILTKIRVATPKEKENKYLFNDNKLISIKKDNKYGFINKNGKVVVEPQYNYINDNTGKYILAEKDGKYYLVDQNGKEKIESEMTIVYNKDYDLYTIDFKLYNSNLNKISPDDLALTYSGEAYYRFVSKDGQTAGVVNQVGKITYKTKIEKGQAFYISVGEKDDYQKYTYCAVSVDGTKYALINCDTGKLIEEYSSGVITAQGNNIFRLDQGSLTGEKTVYVSDDKYVFEKTLDAKAIYYESGYIEYQEDGTKKYFDTKTKKTLESQPDDLYDSNKQQEWENETGYTKIACNRKYGLIENNKVIIPCEYDNIVAIPYRTYNYLKTQGKNIAIAVKNSKTYIINTKNNKVIHKFDTEKTINTSTASPFIYFYEDENQAIVYNLVNNKEIKIEAEKLETYGNYFKAYTNDKILYYNKDMKKIYELDK